MSDDEIAEFDFEFRPRVKSRSTFDLLTARWKKSARHEEIHAADCELERRGYSMGRQKLLRGILFTGLIWRNVVSWDRYFLSPWDFALGWALNTLFLSCILLDFLSRNASFRIALGAFFLGCVPLTLMFLLKLVKFCASPKARYSTLGSHRPRGERQIAFLRSRETFESNRDSWLTEGRTGFVVIQGEEVVCFARDQPNAYRLCKGHLTFHFEIASRDAEAVAWRSNSAPTSSLLARPFLDTDMPDDEFEADRILEVRGYSPAMQECIRFVFGLGLVWQGPFGEWLYLDKYDVLYGWGCNFVLLALPVGILAGYYFGILAASALAGICILPFGLLVGVRLLVRSWERIKRRDE